MPEFAPIAEFLGSQSGLFWTVAVAAVLTVAVSKSGFGGALGSLSAPMMALVIPPKLAITILLPLFLVTDFWVVYTWRRYADWNILKPMMIFGLMGTFVGWALFRQFDDALLRLIIGAIAVLTALRFWRHELAPNLTHKSVPSTGPSLWTRGFGWCGLSGFTSFVSLTGGIPAQIYMLPMRLPREIFVGTMCWFFLIINLAKLPFFLELGMFTPPTLTVSAMLIPAIPIGVYIGRWMNRTMNDVFFYRLSHGLLLIMGAKLMFDAVA